MLVEKVDAAVLGEGDLGAQEPGESDAAAPTRHLLHYRCHAVHLKDPYAAHYSFRLSRCRFLLPISVEIETFGHGMERWLPNEPCPPFHALVRNGSRAGAAQKLQLSKLAMFLLPAEGG